MRLEHLLSVYEEKDQCVNIETDALMKRSSATLTLKIKQFLIGALSHFILVRQAFVGGQHECSASSSLVLYCPS